MVIFTYVGGCVISAFYFIWFVYFPEEMFTLGKFNSCYWGTVIFYIGIYV